MTGSSTLELVRGVFSALLRMVARVLLVGADKLGSERPSRGTARTVAWHSGDGVQPPQHWLDLVEGRAPMDSPRPVRAPSHRRVEDPSPPEPARRNGHRREGTSSQPSEGSPQAERRPDAVESPGEMTVPRGTGTSQVPGTHAVVEEMSAIRGSQVPTGTGRPPGHEARGGTQVHELEVPGNVDGGAAREPARARPRHRRHDRRSIDPTGSGGSRDGSVVPPPDDRLAEPALEVTRDSTLPFEPVPGIPRRTPDRRSTAPAGEAHRSEPSDDRWPELPPPRSIEVDAMELLRARERSARLEAERTAL